MKDDQWNNDHLTGLGVIVGIVVWFLAVLYGASVSSRPCSPILTSIIAVGMLAPAWIAAHLVSSLKPKK